MALHQSDIAKGYNGVAHAGYAGGCIYVRGTMALTAAIVEAADDVVELFCLPADHIVVDMNLRFTDVDTGTPAFVWDCGIMSGEFGVNDATRTCGDEFFDGKTTGQSAGTINMVTSGETDARDWASASTNRGIGIKIVTAAATGAAGTLYFDCLMAAVAA